MNFITKEAVSSCIDVLEMAGYHGMFIEFVIGAIEITSFVWHLGIS